MSWSERIQKVCKRRDGVTGRERNWYQGQSTPKTQSKGCLVLSAAPIDAIVIVDQLLPEAAVQYRDGNIGLPGGQMVFGGGIESRHVPALSPESSLRSRTRFGYGGTDHRMTWPGYPRQCQCETPAHRAPARDHPIILLMTSPRVSAHPVLGDGG